MKDFTISGNNTFNKKIYKNNYKVLFPSQNEWPFDFFTHFNVFGRDT